ncbi:hypothetical protein RZS08_59560, partial [Arthrospira platensis SPKY1]|nr:hypothetical protein [Arthrospira platensis SPKY1]
FPEVPNHGNTLEFVRQHVESGQDVLHQIHIINEPGIRRATDRWINSVMGKGIDRREFQNLILSRNPTFFNGLTQLFSEVISHAEVLKGMGVTVIISPILEPTING